MLNRETIAYWNQNIIWHPVQYNFYHSQARFNVSCAGRRSGKTWKAKRKCYVQFLRVPGLYFMGAPTFPQAKGIFWTDLKAAIPSTFWRKKPNETKCILYLRNGSDIEIIGFDAPARFEGRPWTGGMIDETDDLKESAWATHIRPALDTIGLKTWVILCGVPEGKKLLFDLSKKPAYDSEWDYFHWLSADILTPKTIESAKRDLSALQFRQEYEASFETAEGVVYSDYDSNKNGTRKTIDPRLPLEWTHDFNYTPLSSCIIQEFEDGNYILDEIILKSSVAKNTADEFVNKFKRHQNKRVTIYGDYSGVNGEKHSQSSDYTVIVEILRRNDWIVTRRIKPNPRIKKGQNALRAQICNSLGVRRLFVNIDKCRYVDKGLSRVELRGGSAFQELENEFQHITTALRYWAFTKYEISTSLVGAFDYDD